MPPLIVSLNIDLAVSLSSSPKRLVLAATLTRPTALSAPGAPLASASLYPVSPVTPAGRCVRSSPSFPFIDSASQHPSDDTILAAPPYFNRPRFQHVVLTLSLNQDLKDFGREAGSVSYADIDRDVPGEG